MSKRSTVFAFRLSAATLWMLCMLAAVVMGQKTPDTVTGAPLKGVDVKLGKNPGGCCPASVRTSGPDGIIDLKDLTPGSYWLIVEKTAKPKTKSTQAADGVDDNYLVEITGAVSKVIVRGWDPKTKKFFTLPNARSKAAPVYADKMEFEVGPVTNPPTPLFVRIKRSRSNIHNN